MGWLLWNGAGKNFSKKKVKNAFHNKKDFDNKMTK